MGVERALRDLRKGRFVLVYDSSSRENEVDMVIAGLKATPKAVARMRVDAGGLICVAVSPEIAQELRMPFIQEVYRKSRMPLFKALEANDIPYDEKSSFSITINHRKTFTGITDIDRSLTIREFARLAAKPSTKKFGRYFRTPGHVHTLISSGIGKRRGHTELSTALLEMAGLTPVAAICEMMDDGTGRALSLAKAGAYAVKNKLALIDSAEIVDYWRNRK
jgi:3,4-dihydroxy 2-butanone 4-phosphate synthase